jgi:3-deoxy-D-manno-octulosonic-acid transferase
MMLALLSILSRFSSALLSAAAPLAASLFTSEKARIFFAERRTSHWLNSITQAAKKKSELHDRVAAVYWIHVASAGELEQAIPVMRVLHEKHGVVFFLTYYSPSAIPFLKNCSGLIGASSLPWENSRLYAAAVEALNVRRLILVRYDFWPALISEFSSRRLPVCILAATMRKARSPLPAVMQDKLRTFWLGLSDLVFLVSESEKKLLTHRGMSAEKLIVSGDAKWARARERAEKVKVNELSPPIRLIQEGIKQRGMTTEQRVIIFGSPHKEEIEVLKRTLATDRLQNFMFIIAPQEVDRSTVRSLEDNLQHSNINILKISEISDDGWMGSLCDMPKTPVILLDSFGYLAESYGLADLAVVGGGFDGQLHNVLEPAAFPVLTLFGNRASRAPEAQILLTHDAAIGFATADLLFQFVLRWGSLKPKDSFRGELSQNPEAILRNAQVLFASLPDTSEVICKTLAARDALEVS